MIDPNNIINYERTDAELEELILFLIAVAGKNAQRTAKQIDKLVYTYGIPENTPFKVIKYFESICTKVEGLLFTEILKAHGFGCQTRLAKAFTEIANSGINLRTCTLEDLMKIHGIGMKSASCFLMWTRENTKLAGLDTHILAELRELGYTAPKSTPSSLKEYYRLQEIVLNLAEEANLSPAEWDLRVWRKRSNNI